MTYKLIELQDGTLVQVEANESGFGQIKQSNSPEQIRNVTIDAIRPLLLRISKPVTDVWRELSEDLQVQQAEIEIGLGFEGEGNIFLAKAKGSANIVIRLQLKPKS